ncbi:MAG: hypothetical protein ACREPQ_14245 [Rhodanobacter sp.]
MKITEADRQLWMEMRAHAWLKPAKPPMSRAQLVDRAINGHVPPVTRQVSEPNNTISIIKMVRKREGDAGAIDRMRAMAVAPGCVDGKRRMAFCQKWLRRMGLSVHVGPTNDLAKALSQAA